MLLRQFLVSLLLLPFVRGLFFLAAAQHTTRQGADPPSGGHTPGWSHPPLGRVRPRGRGLCLGGLDTSLSGHDLDTRYQDATGATTTPTGKTTPCAIKPRSSVVFPFFWGGSLGGGLSVSLSVCLSVCLSVLSSSICLLLAPSGRIARRPFALARCSLKMSKFARISGI